MSNNDPGMRPCPQCGTPLPVSRHVCPDCGYVSTWFKIRFGVGCLFAALAIAGVGFMIFLAITQTPPPAP